MIKKNLNPAWGEVFYMYVPHSCQAPSVTYSRSPTDADKDQSKLLIEVWDDDTLNDDFLYDLLTLLLCAFSHP